MDLNFIYERHQVSLFLSDHAECLDARRIHREFAERYAVRIAEARLFGTHLRAV